MKEHFKRPWVWIFAIIGLPIFIFLLIYLFPAGLYKVFSSTPYLTFHTIVESLSIIISLLIFILSWVTHKHTQNSRSLFLGVSFLGVALLDIFHALTFPGMPGFYMAASIQETITYWLLARFWAATALLAASFLPPSKHHRFFSRPYLLGAALTMVALVVGTELFLHPHIPPFYIPDEGLTPLKIALEWVVMALALAAFLFYGRQYLKTQERSLLYLMAGLILTIISEMCFTLYGSYTDTYNLLGHIYKIAAYALFFQTLFIAEIKQPYAALETARHNWQSTFEAISDGIWLQDAKGRVVQTNGASERLLGIKTEAVINQHCYAMVHGTSDFIENCPFKRMQQTGRHESEEMEYRERGLWLQVTVDPVRDKTGAVSGAVHIIQDITERKQAEEERARHYNIQTVINSILHFSLQDIPLEEILQHTLDILLSLSWLAFEERGCIFLVEDDPQVLVMKTQKGLAAPIQEACARLPFGKCLCGRAALTQKTQFADRLDERHEIQYEGILPHGDYCVPILFAGKVLGAINICLKEGHRRDEGEVNFLEAVANALAGIIQRRRTEKLNLRLGRVIDESFNEVYIFDASTMRFLQVSQRACHNLGYTMDELTRMTPLDLKPEFTPERFKALIEPLQTGTAPIITFETFHQRKDGTQYPVEVRLQLSHTETPPVFMAVIQDITERKRMEKALIGANRALMTLSTCREALLRSAEELELLQEVCRVVVEVGGYRLAWVGLAEQDDNKTVRPVAQAGYEEGYLKTLNLSWADNEGGRGPVGTAVRTGRPCIFKNIMTNPDFAFWREEASQRGYVSIVALPLITNDRPLGVLAIYAGEPDAFDEEELKLLLGLADELAYGLMVLRTHAERQSLEEQLRQSQKMEAVGTLAGGVAHDFNNLLTAMTINLELAKAKLIKGESHEAHLEEIDHVIQRAAALTRQLLAFSRRQIIQLVPLNLNDTVTGMSKMLPRLLGEHIELDLRLTGNLARVKVDPGQIEQVIMNLCVNARDAMPAGGRLTLKTENVHLDAGYLKDHPWAQSGDYVLLEVADTGVGMDKATQERIFEPFFTTKEVGKGTGLGLSMVFGIVKQHEGYIDVYSEPGQGTVFKIYLPQIEEETMPVEIKETPKEIEGGKETILLAEDEPQLRESIRNLLQMFGYTVLAATDGQEAVELYQREKERLDLVILDAVMPKLSGKEVADFIHKLNPGQKILFSSGYSADSLHESFVIPAQMHFIQKPYKARALAQKVREVLEG